jgi:sulfite exporter TauE/SafE
MMIKMTSLLIVLTASFIGSWHCAAMCGAFSVAAGGEARSKLSFAAYHFGRLLSYVSLSVLVYAMTLPVVKLMDKFELKYVSVSLSVFLLLVWITLTVVKPTRHLKPPRFIFKMFASIRKTKGYAFALSMGLTTSLLPCIWLYGFIGLAGTQHSIINSVATITAFWLGTLPSLILVQIFSIKLKKVPYTQQIAVLAVVVFSTYNIVIRSKTVLPVSNIPVGASCHESQPSER